MGGYDYREVLASATLHSTGSAPLEPPLQDPLGLHQYLVSGKLPPLTIDRKENLMTLSRLKGRMSPGIYSWSSESTFPQTYFKLLA